MKKPSDKTAFSHYYNSEDTGGSGHYQSTYGPQRDDPGGTHNHRVIGTPRTRLIKAIELAYDPFSSGVSEKDLAPDFGSIYVDLQPGLLKQLQHAEPTCLFANYGMGKTATRIALEYEVRLAPQPPTLVVTYTPNLDPNSAATEHTFYQHLEAIAAELRIDMFIQYMERLPERAAEGQTTLDLIQQRALHRQARALPTRFTSAIRTALNHSEKDGAFWHALRPVVRHVAATPTWRSLAETIAKAAQPSSAAKPSWEETVYDTHSLGFEQIFILVDAVDEGMSNADAYLDIVGPLLSAADDLTKQHIYLKFFLPLELQEALETQSKLYNNALTSLKTIATINKISSTNLDDLIDSRFLAASTSVESYRSLDWFGPEVGESIQARLIEIANGSPRRLIELVSALIDFHSLNGFRSEGRVWLTRDEWQRFLEEEIERTSSPFV